MEHNLVDCTTVKYAVSCTTIAPASASPPGTAGAALASVGVARTCTLERSHSNYYARGDVALVCRRLSREGGGVDAAPWGARGMFVSDATVAHVCAERPEIE